MATCFPLWQVRHCLRCRRQLDLRVQLGPDLPGAMLMTCCSADCGLVPDADGCNGEQHLIMAGQRSVLIIACLRLNLDIWRGVTCTDIANIIYLLELARRALRKSDHGSHSAPDPSGTFCGQFNCCRAYPALVQ